MIHRCGGGKRIAKVRCSQVTFFKPRIIDFNELIEKVIFYRNRNFENIFSEINSSAISFFDIPDRRYGEGRN